MTTIIQLSCRNNLVPYLFISGPIFRRVYISPLVYV